MEGIDEIISKAMEEINAFIPIDKDTKKEYDMLVDVKSVKHIIEKYIRIASTKCL